MSRARDLADGTFTGTVTASVDTTGDFNFYATSDGGGAYRIYPDDATTANPVWQHQSNSNESQSWVIGGVERMRVLSSGGLTFNGDTAAANALDDYEEGTWSPYWCDSNGNAIFNASPNVNFAHYTKVGRYVTASCYFNMPSSFGTTSYYGSGGALRLGGLPFTAYATGSNNYYAGSVGWYSSWSWDASGYSIPPMIYTRHNTTVLNLVYPTTNGVGTILMQNVNVGGSGMIITATYFTQT